MSKRTRAALSAEVAEEAEVELEAELESPAPQTEPEVPEVPEVEVEEAPEEPAPAPEPEPTPEPEPEVEAPPVPDEPVVLRFLGPVDRFVLRTEGGGKVVFLKGGRSSVSAPQAAYLLERFEGQFSKE